jgi:predicted transcriptional regulator
MRTLDNLTAKDQKIVDTIILRCEREWVSTKELTREFGLDNVQSLVGYIKMLKAEGYVFQRKVKKKYSFLHESFYRITGEKP